MKYVILIQIRWGNRHGKGDLDLAANIQIKSAAPTNDAYFGVFGVLPVRPSLKSTPPVEAPPREPAPLSARP